MAKRKKIPINLNLNVRGLKKSATLAINERSRKLAAQGKEIFFLGFGQSPFPVPEPVVEALKKNAHQKDYLAVQGLYPLRQTIATYFKRRQGLDYSPEDIMVSPGSKELLFLLQLVYYGDLVMPMPSWVSYSPQAMIIGRRVNWVKTHPENDWRLSPEELEALCKMDPDRPRIVIINYPANPTGATYSEDRLREIAAIARKYRVILLSDEIYGELHHSGRHVSVARYYPEGTIVSSGLSKWCGAGGWRLGMFLFPPDLRWLLDAMAVVASETYTSTSAPIQYAAITAFEEHPVIERQLHESRRILRVLGQYLYRRLRELHIHTPEPQGGFYLFPDFSHYQKALEKRGVQSSADLCEQLLEETGVALLPSYDFGRPSEELTARLSYVDFDGEKALKMAASHGDKPLDDAFMQACCPRVLEAMDRIADWVGDLQQ
ncbi:pyridoxal phosphate-dependent aminotransferase [Flavilitoribacter nigricans]|uniref:Aminotransferase n=1 Tax=Flavilitoribacter nigricans (strain ATCC 23147 / DSM 23189 / NBRC 102662 / NCIMB 1420 / SS-2) TaxID=1122177 RepID=A0A2D0MWM3_FLAN2|nr:aminotransferase class I/II-fold pyridoxal phosphate-dependent enzyme [Flavilitoribacter nigricans]PHN00682.1 aspartate aminotransferase [Flavilitoribacter nigricans DSM 23189 = NBRC 102662]